MNHSEHIASKQEMIEDQLEKELGWRWTPQMRHAYKVEKIWKLLIDARLKLQEIYEQR